MVVVGRRLRERYASRNRLNATARTAASSFPSARRSSTAENPSVDRGRSAEVRTAGSPGTVLRHQRYGVRAQERSDRASAAARPWAAQQGPGQRAACSTAAIPRAERKHAGKACRERCLLAGPLSPTGAKKDFSSSFGPGAAQTKAKAKASSLLDTPLRLLIGL